MQELFASTGKKLLEKEIKNQDWFAAVKYHARENYRKLGVSGKADAVLAVRNLGII